MSDFRSNAEKFVSNFLDYIYKYDIHDEFDKRTQKMVRSAGVQALVKEAEAVFPKRADDGKAETDKLTVDELESAIDASNNVIDRRDVFSRKIQKNGAARGLLERVLAGDKDAVDMARELIAADNGKKEFHVQT